MSTLIEYQHLAPAQIRESLTNPRKIFRKIEELAESIKAQGVLEPLLVRPLTGQVLVGNNQRLPMFELVAGARRLRASLRADVATVPCVVRELSDAVAREIQIVENLQRSDLTELEEAESYDGMLKINGEDGKPLYSVPQLAERFSVERSFIYRRLKLLELPKTAREALENNVLPARVAVLIARIPDPELREKAAMKIVKPQHSKEPLTFIAASELIAEEFMQGLKGAPFKLDDAELLPAAGACAACPKMTDNCAHLFGQEKADAELLKKKVCCDPTCFRLKLDALFKRQAATAEEAGATVLGEKASREIYPSWRGAGEMDWDTNYVEIRDQPQSSLLKPEVGKVGTWRKLIEEAEKKTGAKVPRVIAKDQAGAPREVVDRKLAIAAIEKAGEPIFASRIMGGSAVAGSNALALERKKALAESKKQLAVTCEALTAVHRELASNWTLDPVWDAIFDAGLSHAGADGLWIIGKWKNLKFGDHGTDKEKTIRTWAKTLTPAERQALVPLLLVSQSLKWSGVKADGVFWDLAEGVAVDLDQIKKDVTQRLKDEKVAKKTAAKEKAKPAAKAAKAPKAPKPAKVKGDASAAYKWNKNGVAERPFKSSVLGMPDGANCEVRIALDSEGTWRCGLDIRSRTEGKAGFSYSPSLSGKKFATEADAIVGACTEALPFFKDDPVAFKVLALEADPLVVAAIEKDMVAAPVTTDPKILAEWVKAAAGGMPAEEIARSYGVPLADVEGALAGKESAPQSKKTKRAEITVELKHRVCRMHGAGCSGAEIAKELSISLPSVQNIKKEFGLIKPRVTVTEPAAAAEPPAQAPLELTPVGVVPAAEDERYAGLPANKHTAIDMINAGKTTHEIAAASGLTLAEVIILRGQMKHDAAEESRGVDSAA